MAKTSKKRCKYIRRLGELDGLLSGIRSVDSKCKHDMTPGQFAAKRRPTLPAYAGQLRDKNAMRRSYGVSERQFQNYYVEASRLKGSTGENLAQLLERRLDNVVYRLGFASTRAEARQLVSHKSISVNGRRVNIPSYLVGPGDQVTVLDKGKKQLRVSSAIELAKQRSLPEWMDVNHSEMYGTYKHHPSLAELGYTFNIQLIVEYYSK